MAALHSILLTALAAVGAGSMAGPRDSEVEARLASLSAPTGAEREAAERWLVQNLTAGDRPLVEARARDGDAEVRRRIEHALAAADRHLGLALALARSDDAGLRAVGEGALVRSIERWNPRLSRSTEAAASGRAERPGTPGVSDDVAALVLDLRLGLPPTLFELELADPLPRTLGRLARSGRIPLPIVLEPGFTGTPQSPGKRISTGPWDLQLAALAEHHGARMDAPGASDSRPGGFLLFTNSVEAPRTGAESVLRWLRLTARTGEIGAQAVEALAATGWPAWLSHLSTRWAESRDDRALTGLAVAASQGFLPPEVLTPDVVRAWLAKATAGDSNALEALGACGSFFGDGSSTLPILLEGWDGLGARARWTRLVVFERLRSSDPRVRRVAGEILAAAPGVVRSPLRIQALRAFVAGAFPPPAPPEVGDVTALLEDLHGVEDARRRARLLARSGLRPAGSWADPDRVPALPFTSRLVLLRWSRAMGQEVAAARTLTGLLSEAASSEAGLRSRSEALGALLREDPGEERRSLRLFEVARAAATVDIIGAIDRTALLAGALPFERRAELLKVSVANGAWTEPEPDLALLGAFGGLAGEPSAASARETLLTLLAANVLEEEPDRLLLDSLQRALDDLYRSGQDPEAGVLLRRLHRTLGAGRQGWPSQGRRYAWPHPPGAPILKLERVERVLAPGALGD